MARIYKRGQVYWVQWYVGDGKYQRESTHSDKLSDAKRLAKTKEAMLAEGCHHRCYKSLYQRNKMSPVAGHLLYLQRDHCSGGADAQKGGLDGHQDTC